MGRLAGRSHVIAPDYPGFGESAPLSGSTTFDRLADSIDAFIDAAGLDRFSLYMFDFGSPVGSGSRPVTPSASRDSCSRTATPTRLARPGHAGTDALLEGPGGERSRRPWPPHAASHAFAVRRRRGGHHGGQPGPGGSRQTLPGPARSRPGDARPARRLPEQHHLVSHVAAVHADIPPPRSFPGAATTRSSRLRGPAPIWRICPKPSCTCSTLATSPPRRITPRSPS